MLNTLSDYDVPHLSRIVDGCLILACGVSFFAYWRRKMLLLGEKTENHRNWVTRLLWFHCHVQENAGDLPRAIDYNWLQLTPVVGAILCQYAFREPMRIFGPRFFLLKEGHQGVHDKLVLGGMAMGAGMIHNCNMAIMEPEFGHCIMRSPLSGSVYQHSPKEQILTYDGTQSITSHISTSPPFKTDARYVIILLSCSCRRLPHKVLLTHPFRWHLNSRPRRRRVCHCGWGTREDDWRV